MPFRVSLLRSSQHLAKAALSPLRYVFLRYGGYISDDVEACAPTIVTSSWQTAIEKKVRGNGQGRGSQKK